MTTLILLFLLMKGFNHETKLYVEVREQKVVHCDRFSNPQEKHSRFEYRHAGRNQAVMPDAVLLTPSWLPLGDDHEERQEKNCIRDFERLP